MDKPIPTAALGINWTRKDLKDRLAERYQAVLELTQDEPSRVLSGLVRAYIESVEQDGAIIDECETELVGNPRAPQIIKRFHRLRDYAAELASNE